MRIFKSDPDLSAEMVEKMSGLVIEQENKILIQKDKLIDLSENLIVANLELGESRGYINRVRELDNSGKLTERRHQ